MKPYTIVAIILVGAGILALAYGQFTYTKDSESANLGPIVLTVTDKETVNIPQWVGVGSIVLGAGLLVFPLVKQ